MADTTATVAAVVVPNYEAAYVPTAKNYQYWSMKFAPYVQTNIQLSNTFYFDQLFSINLSMQLSSFKALIWADFAFWWQYDGTNPQNPLLSSSYTNYKNYFICSDGGITIKPILFSINIAITLKNCYKTLIQSLTDWSNWTKLGPQSLYWGILDFCQNSSPESVTIYSLNPVASDYNLLFWGNSNNGNPSVDWGSTEGTNVVFSTFY